MPSHTDDLRYMCQTGDSSAPLYDVHRTLECGELRLVEHGMSVWTQHRTRAVLYQLCEQAAQLVSTGWTHHHQVNNQSAVTEEIRVHAWNLSVELPSPRPAPGPIEGQATTHKHTHTSTLDTVNTSWQPQQSSIHLSTNALTVNMNIHKCETTLNYQTRFPSNLRQVHPQMHAFSYVCSFPVTWQRWRLHHLIRCTQKPHAACKHHGSMFDTTGVIADRSFTLRE